MADEITVAGRQYVSSKRASELSGYTQDYIGQLARSGQIEAQRVGGLWYLLYESLDLYVKNPTGVKSPKKVEIVPSDEVSADGQTIFFDEREYISASRASQLSGYNQDYVGQLARSGQILARQISNRWYVDREGILKHKEEKDALLAAVQSQSVGIQAPVPVHVPKPDDDHSVWKGPEMQYFKDDSELLPRLSDKPSVEISYTRATFESQEEPTTRIPIRLLDKSDSPSTDIEVSNTLKVALRQKRSGIAESARLAAMALTVVIVLSFGVVTLRHSSVYVSSIVPSNLKFAAGTDVAFESIADQIEQLVNPELIFVRD